MKTAITTLTLLLAGFFIQTDFLAEQKKYKRVREAFSEKGKLMAETLKENKIATAELTILLTAFKAEKELHLYAKNKAEAAYKKIATYQICAASGGPGPKRQQGDLQVPEGFYHIDRFNPASRFHLSLGINYPNQSDKRKSKAADPGGDIFIHGSCVTIGCIPLTDDKIREVYLYAIQARHNGQLKIPVYLFPFKMTGPNMSSYRRKYRNKPELLNFWLNLATGYDSFEKEKKEIKFSVDSQGNYKYEKNHENN